MVIRILKVMVTPGAFGVALWVSGCSNGKAEVVFLCLSNNKVCGWKFHLNMR